MNNNFWLNKNVLVTGHTGFIGSWLCLILNKFGARVNGYALNPITDPSIFKLTGLSDSMNSVIGDLRNMEICSKEISQINPEIVFHLAAQPLVRESYINPIDTFSTNVIGTANLFEALRDSNSLKTIINFTTDKCYENKEWVWGYRETDRLGGFDPYSTSKACSELVTNSYRESFYNKKNVGIATVRAGNVVGGGDWSANRLIPDIIKSFLKEEKVIIRYPDAIRPWQHVLEPLNGILLLGEKLYNDPIKFSEPWNFGPDKNKDYSVSWVVDYISELWGNGASWVVDQNEHPHEATNLMLDCSKAKYNLGWKSNWNIESTLEKTVEWYKIASKSPNNALEITNKQINEYYN